MHTEAVVNVKLVSSSKCPYPPDVDGQLDRVVIDERDELLDGFLWVDLDVEPVSCNPYLDADKLLRPSGVWYSFAMLQIAAGMV